MEGKGEFTDYDLNTTDGAQSAAKGAATQSRVSAVDQFRSNLKPEDAGNIRATVNETGAMKNFFIEGARCLRHSLTRPLDLAVRIEATRRVVRK